MLMKKVTVDEDYCSGWKPLRIRDDEFYWCSTCRTRLIGVEARIHLARGHRVHVGAYLERDIREELYSVF